MAFFKSIYISTRFFILIALISIILLVSNWFSALYGIAWLLIYVLIFLLTLDLSMLFQKQGISATRVLPEKFSNSDLNEVFIKLKNNYHFKTYISIIDELPFQFQNRNFLIELSLDGKLQKTITYEVKPVERGAYEFGNLNCFVSSPIKFLKRKYSFSENQQVKVYPSFIQMKKYDFLAIDSKFSHLGLKKIRRIGHTMEFEQIKEYVAGDDLRTINWKATAKKSNPMVNQYQDEKMQPVYSIIDTSRVMKMPFEELNLLDYAINSTLAFSNIALKKGDKVGFIDFSNKINKWLPAKAKPTQLAPILENLYKINSKYYDSDFGLLQASIKRRIKQRSLILLYTNFEHISSLERQLKYLQSIAKSHVLVVIFFENTEINILTEEPTNTISGIYNQTIARQFQSDKYLIAKALQNKGIQTVLTAPQDLTVKTINKYLEIKLRGLL